MNIASNFWYTQGGVFIFDTRIPWVKNIQRTSARPPCDLDLDYLTQDDPIGGMVLDSLNFQICQEEKGTSYWELLCLDTWWKNIP